MNTITLPPFYYRDNFQQLLDRAGLLPAELQTERERQLTSMALLLSPQALALLVRLLTRKGNLFRSERLAWAELPDLIEPVAELVSAGWVRVITARAELNDLVGVDEWLALYNRDELLQAWGDQLVGITGVSRSKLKSWRREQLDEICKQALTAGQLQRCDLQTALWWQLVSDCSQWLETLLLLYFGNLQQSLTEFVLRDLGLARYEDLPLDASLCPFHSRTQLDAHRALFHLSPDDDWLKAADADALQLRWNALQDIRERVVDDEWLQRRWMRMVTRLARQAERLALPELALDWYQSCECHPARERRIRLLAIRDPWQALAECRAAWFNSYSEDEWQFLQGFVPRLGKQLGKLDRQRLQTPGVIDWYQPAALPAEQFLTLPTDWKQRWPRVEQAVLDLLAEQGRPGIYVENALIVSVFGLLYWPLLFAAVEGAFFHPFQYRPDDLYEPDFLTRRQLWLQEIEADLDSGVWIDRVQQRAIDKMGIQNPFVYWEFVAAGLEQGWFETVLKRIPLEHWRAMFEFIWQDPKAHRSGLPDLLILEPDGGYQLLEVKGPGDQLQANQKSWLAWFASQNIPAAVLYARPEPV